MEIYVSEIAAGGATAVIFAKARRGGYAPPKLAMNLPASADR